MTKLRTLRAGASAFNDEAADLIHEVEDNALRHIDAGLPGLTARLVPHLEAEALARLRHGGVKTYGDTSVLQKTEPDQWRLRWVVTCVQFLQEDTTHHPESLMRAAANIVLTCHRMREAIGAGEAERAAAHAVLLMSWLSIGGISTRARIGGQQGGRASAETRRESARVPSPQKLRAMRAELIAAGTESRAVASKLAARFHCSPDAIRKALKKQD